MLFINSCKKVLTGFLFFIALIIISISCDSTEPTDDPIIIPTTEAKGPGGPAYLWGNIKDYVHPQNDVTNIQVSIMKQQNYADTILSILVNSTDGSFKLTDLPLGKYDIIFEGKNYLCAKLGKLNFVAQENSFNNPNSSGYFIDSTIFITNKKDSVGRPDAPPFGLQGYISGLSVYFKEETMDSIAWQIFQNSQCDTLHVYHFNDPVFDPFENDVYILICTDLDFVNNALVFFNYKNEVLYASPNYEFTEQ